MKYIFTIFCFITFSYFLLPMYSQDYINQRYDRQLYLSSYGGNACLNNDVNDTIYTRGVIMDFQDDTLSMSAIDTYKVNIGRPKFSYTYLSTQICDPTGHFLAHFNGAELTDRYFNKIEIPIFKHEQYNSYFSSFSISGAVILPLPGHENKYILIGGNDYKTDINKGVPMAEDISTVVFSAKSDGLLEIQSQKTSYLPSRYPLNGMISACRHANGRDWWIVAPHRDGHLFHFFLLTPEGLQYSHDQHMDTPIFVSSNYGVFSPQGNYYSRTLVKSRSMYEKDNYAQIYKFDRCSGSFTTPIELSIPYEDTAAIGQLYFESNERYFYANTATSLWQGDIQSDDINASLVRVGRYDPTLLDNFRNLAIGFSWMSPDGKIYIGDGSNKFRSSVIHNPSRRGMACDFEYAGIEKPSCSSILDNVPHFGLGPLDGSPCDTLGLDGPMHRWDIDITSANQYTSYPNPTTGLIHVSTDDTHFSGSIRVYDILGQKIYDEKYSVGMSLDLSANTGVVFIQWLNRKGQVVSVGKVVIYK